jgi:protein tyrosine phosphatase (PTP) superfamily phosphohydrolase (DUF442 family)
MTTIKRNFKMCLCRSLLAVATLFLGCLQPTTPSATDTSARPEATHTKAAVSGGLKKLSAEHLPNAVQVHPRVISGGLPQGDAGFAELRDLGVKSVISVDGAKPDVETAAKYGLRYVHLPHGYDGIPQQRAQELAKAVRDLEGVVYIHCHHGRHRSPAAASVACVTAGLIDPSLAVRVLELAGTSANYRGLYQSASAARPLEEALLDALQVEFREMVNVPPIAEAMVALEHTHDNLGEIAAAGWRTPEGHPDLEPAHEALLLREHFTELLRTDEVQQQPEEFRQLLRESDAVAQKLEDELRAFKTAAGDATPPDSLGRLAERITANCKACHQKYRDVPLDEKPRPN